MKLKINLDLHIENSSAAKTKNTFQPFYSAKNRRIHQEMFAVKYNKERKYVAKYKQNVEGNVVRTESLCACLCGCVCVRICVLSGCHEWDYG